MSQRFVEFNGMLIVSGTDVMRAHEGGGHTREMDVTMPKFASTPDFTLTIFSDDHRDDDQDTETDNSGTSFAPWAIQYLALDGVGGDDRLVISAASTNHGVSSKARVFCSYIAIGEPSGVPETVAD